MFCDSFLTTHRSRPKAGLRMVNSKEGHGQYIMALLKRLLVVQSAGMSTRAESGPWRRTFRPGVGLSLLIAAAGDGFAATATGIASTGSVN